MHFINCNEKKKPDYSWKKVMTAREIIAELSKNNWELVRVRGSHYIFVKNEESVIVPFHRNVKKGVFENIKKHVEFVETKSKKNETSDLNL